VLAALLLIAGVLTLPYVTDNITLTISLLIYAALIYALLSSAREPFSAASDSQYVDPRVHPYSRTITYRPDTPAMYVLNDDVNNDPNKLYDHLDDQERGMRECDGAVNLVNECNKSRSVKPVQPDTNEQRKVMAIRQQSAQLPVSTYISTIPRRDSLHETNNLTHYCAEDDPELNDMTARPYTKQISVRGELALDDPSNPDHYEIVSRNVCVEPRVKRYVQLNDAYGKYKTFNSTSVVQDITDLESAGHVVDKSEHDALIPIQGTYIC